MGPNDQDYDVLFSSASGYHYRFHDQSIKLAPAIVQVDDQTSHSTTGTAWEPTALTATIKPNFASSRIKVTVSGNGAVANANNGMNISLLRNGTDLSVSGSGFSQIVTAAPATRFPVGFSYLDSPATILPVTYTLAVNSGTNGQSVTWNPAGNDCVIILEEILA